jgi:EAL domain-containing protein (putative c-di-GMP-specific phosphodiesterase class I)
MYIAKQMGRNRYHLFDIHKDKSIQTQHESIANIKLGLKRGEFVLYCQPKVNMRTGCMVGVEALIRWQHPKLGLLPPGEFLPIIDKHLVSVRIGEWVIERALDLVAEWQSSGLEIAISVNIDPFQLLQPDFVDKLTAALAKRPTIKPSLLELEILETSALGDITEVLAIMQSCIALGVSFSLDDFGTGFSSLTYLKRLPVAQLKIDQSFVRDMLVDPDDRAIVVGVISLASAFNRKVIAEGVETIEHGTQLLSLGCEVAQGFGIAKPMLPEHIPGWLESWQADPAWIK